jgi:hypothetical protein
MVISSSDNRENAMPDVLAPPLAISIRDVSAAAADSVAKLPSRYRPFIPAHPNYRIGFVRPWWWIGVVIVPPEMENIALNDVHGLAAEVHAGIAQTVDGVRNAKPGVVLGDGFLTIGFAPPNEFDVIEA